MALSYEFDTGIAWRLGWGKGEQFGSVIKQTSLSKYFYLHQLHKLRNARSGGRSFAEIVVRIPSGHGCLL
jgi:hypothetical protein